MWTFTRAGTVRLLDKVKIKIWQGLLVFSNAECRQAGNKQDCLEEKWTKEYNFTIISCCKSSIWPNKNVELWNFLICQYQEPTIQKIKWKNLYIQTLCFQCKNKNSSSLCCNIPGENPIHTEMWCSTEMGVQKMRQKIWAYGLVGERKRLEATVENVGCSIAL